MFPYATEFSACRTVALTRVREDGNDGPEVVAWLAGRPRVGV